VEYGANELDEAVPALLYANSFKDRWGAKA
jgi:hypothetical protein